MDLGCGRVPADGLSDAARGSHVPPAWVSTGTAQHAVRTTRITSWVATVLMISAIACGGQSEKTPVVEPSSQAQSTTSAEASGVEGISVAGRTFFVVGSRGHKLPDKDRIH
ncbi:MAG: hypothetical protein FWD57_11385 [Polyangiaceae bacterium]|nr:hypothetical protein [Polyangiaceae bacterium]